MGDADMGTAGFQLSVSASTSSDDDRCCPDAQYGRVRVVRERAQRRRLRGHFPTHDFTVGDGTFSVAATCTDISGNSATATPVTGVIVDTTPPTCSFVAPTAAGSPYGDFQHRDHAECYRRASGQPVAVTVTDSSNGSTVGTINVSGATQATGTLSYPNGMQTLSATVSDAAGNAATCGTVIITVMATGCPIAFDSPVAGSSGKVFINQALNTSASTTTATVQVTTGHTDATCGAGKTVTLLNGPTVMGATQIGTGVTVAGGGVTITNTTAEGGPYTLHLSIDNGAGIITPADLGNVIVDLTPPAVTVQFHRAEAASSSSRRATLASVLRTSCRTRSQVETPTLTCRCSEHHRCSGRLALRLLHGRARQDTAAHYRSGKHRRSCDVNCARKARRVPSRFRSPMPPATSSSRSTRRPRSTLFRRVHLQSPRRLPTRVLRP